MTIALWCVMVAAVLPLVCTGIAKSGFESYDNRNPRAWLARQEGWRARANSAQQNSWEALMVFACGVFAAHLAAGPQPRIDWIALGFVAARLVYIWCYVTDRATLRSIVWSIGFLLSLSLFFAGL